MLNLGTKALSMLAEQQGLSPPAHCNFWLEKWISSVDGRRSALAEHGRADGIAIMFWMARSGSALPSTAAAAADKRLIRLGSVNVHRRVSAHHDATMIVTTVRGAVEPECCEAIHALSPVDGITTDSVQPKQFCPGFSLSS
jgi:hypothetical protein